MVLLTPQTITATTTPYEYDSGGELALLIIKNDGADTVYIDFDKNVSVSVAPLLNGETISLDLGSNNSRKNRKVTLLSAGSSTVRIWGATRDEE